MGDRKQHKTQLQYWGRNTPTKNPVLNSDVVHVKLLFWRQKLLLPFTAQLCASRHVTCFRLPQWQLLEKEEYYASILERQALTLEQMCRLFYLKRASETTWGHILKMCTQMSMPWCLELQLNSHVLTRIFHRQPQALCLQHNKRHAWRNLLRSYARTWRRAVSLMAWASESFVKNRNWGTISWKYLYK